MELFNQNHDLQSIDESTSTIQSMIDSEGMKFRTQHGAVAKDKNRSSAEVSESLVASFAEFLNPHVETFVSMRDDPEFTGVIVEFDNLIQDLSNNLFPTYKKYYEQLGEHVQETDSSGNNRGNRSLIIAEDYGRIQYMDEQIMKKIGKIEEVQNRLIMMKEKNIEMYQTYKTKIDQNIETYHLLLSQLTQIQSHDVLTYQEFSKQNHKLIEEENYYYLMATLVGITFVVGIFNFRR